MINLSGISTLLLLFNCYTFAHVSFQSTIYGHTFEEYWNKMESWNLVLKPNTIPSELKIDFLQNEASFQQMLELIPHAVLFHGKS